IGILGILAALLVPAVSHAGAAAKKAGCVSNLRQVNLAIRIYADEHLEALPALPATHPYPNGVGAYYKQSVKGYLGLTGLASPREMVFTCPSDRTIRVQVQHAFASFTFNGYESDSSAIPRVTGKRLSAINNPSKAVLLGDWPGFFGGSWHPV